MELDIVKLTRSIGELEVSFELWKDFYWNLFRIKASHNKISLELLGHNGAFIYNGSCEQWADKRLVCLQV